MRRCLGRLRSFPPRCRPGGVARAWRVAGTRWLGALLAICLAGPVAAQQDEGLLEGMALVEALREGGYNLYFRHEATDWSLTDQVAQPGDWSSCDPARMRQLSAAGRARARQTGAAMRALAIPIGRVYASPYCRTVQTAQALDLGSVETTTDVMNLRVAEYFGGRASIASTARIRLAASPGPTRNDVYVAHGNVAREATAVYPGEGEALVFRPIDGQAFDFVGRLTPAQWQALAATTDAPTTR